MLQATLACAALSAHRTFPLSALTCSWWPALTRFGFLCFCPAAGTLPFDATLGIPRAAWESLPQMAQELALQAGKDRALLAKLAVLKELETLDHTRLFALAKDLHITLVSDADGKAVLGLIDVPDLGTSIASTPKGELRVQL